MQLMNHKITRTLFSLCTLFALIVSTATNLNRGVVKGATITETGASQRSMQWSVTGPLGGDVRSLVIDPQDPQRLYIGTLDGQIYTSTDGGLEWTRLAEFNRPGLYIDHLIVDPRDSKVVYAAAHRHKEPGGFFKTTDGGATWRESSELKTEAVHSLTQAASNADVLIAGTNRGVFRSADAGETWAQLATSTTPGLINVESLAIDPRDANVIYAGTWYLPYKTTDGGNTWNIIKTGMIDDSDIFAIEIDNRHPDHVIASACSGIYETKNGGANWRKVNGIPSQSRRTRAILQHPSKANVIYAGTTEGFWLSTNGGDDWRVTTSRQNFEVNAIAVHPKNPDIVYIGTNNFGLMISRDGGKTFAPSNAGYSGRRAYTILPDREKPGRFYAATINTATGGGYFYVSNDGGETWQLSNRNMPNRLIAYAILQDKVDGNIIYLGTNYGMYRSDDRGASWGPITAPKPKPPVKSKRGRRAISASTAAVRRTDSQEGTAVAPTTAVVKRTDDNVKRAQAALNAMNYNVGTPDGVAGTRTVTAVRKFQADKGIPQSGKFDDATLIALGLAGGMQSASGADAAQNAPLFLSDIVNALAYTVDERDGRPGLLAATNVGLFRSYDLTRGWERIAYGTEFDARTLCLSTSEQKPSTIYVGTATSGALVSRDSGATWQQVTGIRTDAPVNVIEQDPQRADYIYVGSTQTFYVSHDGGERWMRRGGGLPLGSFTSVVVNSQNTDEVFIGNAYEYGGTGSEFSTREGGGVFRSTDAGMTWERLDPALPSRRIWSLALDSSDPGKILVGTHSAGVFVARRGANPSVSSVK